MSRDSWGFFRALGISAQSGDIVAPMPQHEGNLLNEIQRDALDARTPVANTLRKLVALGGVAGSTELQTWASLELRGYFGSSVELPDYRKPAPCC